KRASSSPRGIVRRSSAARTSTDTSFTNQVRREISTRRAWLFTRKPSRICCRFCTKMPPEESKRSIKKSGRERVLTPPPNHKQASEPARLEPRVKKRRPKKFPFMTHPRALTSTTTQPGGKSLTECH